MNQEKSSARVAELFLLFQRMHRPLLPKQPPKFISYLRVGKLLYISLGLFALESVFFWKLFQRSLLKGDLLFQIIWMLCFLFSFIHIFLVLMDGWSRYQNYKRVKDQFYIHGFDIRLASNYKGSKCQRMAAIVAASELGMEKEIRGFYMKCGVKSFHFIPYFMIQDPLFLFRKSFWSRTFLEKPYRSKFNYRKIFNSQITVNTDLTTSV